MGYDDKMGYNNEVLKLIKVIKKLKEKKLKEKIMKPVSEETLEEAIGGEPEKLMAIKNCCIIVTTGQDMGQRRDAMKELMNYLSDDQIYVSSIIMDGIRVITLTTNNLPQWYIIDEMPEKLRTYKTEKGIESFVVQ